MEECDRRNETASANWPSQHIQRPGRVSLSCEKLPSAPRCCPASGFGASSAPGASSPWPPHFLWKRWGWCGYPPPSPSLRLLSPPRSLTHSPSLSLNFLMATSSLVSCKDTWMQSERRGKEEEKWAKKPAGNIKKKENGMSKLQEKPTERRKALVLFMHRTRMQKALQHPWHGSCAILPLSVGRLISLKKWGCCRNTAAIRTKH